MKKIIRWLGGICVVLLLFPLLMLTALYIPSVQRWIGAAAMRHLSEKVGYACTVKRLQVRFPFRLHVDGFCMGTDNDTLLSVELLRTDVALGSLLQGNVEVSYLVLEDAVLHPDALQQNVQVGGKIAYIRLDNVCFMRADSVLDVGGVSISGVNVHVMQQAHVEGDGDASRHFPLMLSLGDMALGDVSVDCSFFVGHLHAEIPSLALKEVAVDTSLTLSMQHGGLQEAMLCFRSGTAYDSGHEWCVEDLSLYADSLHVSADSIGGILTSLTLHEGHGIVVEEAYMAFSVVDNVVRLPYFVLHTEVSSLSGHLRGVDLRERMLTLDGNIQGELGYADVLCMGKLFPESSFLELYPQAPLVIDIALDCSFNAVYFTRCRLSLATAFEVDMTGRVVEWSDYKHLFAQLDVVAQLHNVDFLSALLDETLRERVRIPHDMVLEATFSYQPDSLLAQLDIRFDGGAIALHGSYYPTVERYALILRTEALDVRRILPEESLGVATMTVAVEGDGLDWEATESRVVCSIGIDSIGFADRTYSNAQVSVSLYNQHLQMVASYTDMLLRFNLKGEARYSERRLQAHLYAHVLEADLHGLGVAEIDIRPSFQSHWALSVDSDDVYTLRAHLYDITLSSDQRMVRPLPLRLNARVSADSIAMSLFAGDLHLTACAHAFGLPWQWNKLLDERGMGYKRVLSAPKVSLYAGIDNPISSYLALAGITVSSINVQLYEEAGHLEGTASVGRCSMQGLLADTLMLTARYKDDEFVVHAQLIGIVWQRTMLQLTAMAEAEISWDGTSRLDNLRGVLKLSDVNLRFPAYDMQLTMKSPTSIPLYQGRLLVQDVALYAAGKRPVLLNGSVLLLGGTPSLDLRFEAHDVSLLQNRRTGETMLYGTALLDGKATLIGPFDALVLSGELGLRGGSTLYYIYKDASLAANNNLDDVVSFVDFSGELSNAVQSVNSRSNGGFAMNLNVTIAPTVQLEVLLGNSGENSGSVQGGGSFNVQYIPAVGLRLSGRYIVASGELQINVPLLHVHTMTLRPGGTVQWSGNALNPLLDIVLEDRMRASVTIDDIPQSVLFVAGVSLYDTMERLGVQFTLSAPENASMQNLLAALSSDERSKLAVALLTTGLYLGEGGTGNLMNTALLGFLQSQLDNISRDTFRSVDVSFGIEPLQDGVSGISTRTDYSFSIAKRLWHDRIRIAIGGSVTTSNERIEENAIIDNVSVEWRIKPNGSQYFHFFYNKNIESILEGEVRETGVGYVYRKQF